MFAYCNNNPVNYVDPTGALPQIWWTLFKDHNPGYIHRLVQAHIIGKDALIFKKELRLEGVGRADIYDPKTNELWEIKHGGRTPDMSAMRMSEAYWQVKNYVKAKLNELHRIGHAGAFAGSFSLTLGDTDYKVTYDTPMPGVILYYVEQMQKNTSPAFAVYPSNAYNYASMGVLALGCSASYAFLGSGSSYDPQF